MDRSETSWVVDCAAVRPAGTVSVELLLRSGRHGETGEHSVDAADRRVVPEASILRLATDDAVVETTGMVGERETSGTTDAADGSASCRARSPYESASSGTSDLSVPAAGRADPGARRSLVRRYHLYSHASRVFVPGGRDGLVQPLRACVGAVEFAGGSVLSQCPGAGIGHEHAGDLQHRPGCAVYQRGFHGAARDGGGTGKHGRSRPSDGQYLRGAVVANGQVRGGLPAGLHRWDRGAAGIESVLPVLQHGATAPGVGKPNACDGLP